MGKDGIMQIVKITGLIIVCTFVLLLNGCGEELGDLKVQNRTQQGRIAEIESQLQVSKLNLDQLKRQLGAAQKQTSIETTTLQQKIAALEEELAKKKVLIASMQKQLLLGGAALPVELSTTLEDFAKSEEMVTYNPDKGVIKFKSDLLFEKGSDVVATSAINAVKSLCKILNSEQARQFDIIVAGHTDDMRISKPQTRQKHPTNWHLSAHRAISVLNVMTKNNVVPERLSARGFGEFRSLEPNKPNKKGNPKNRRVEIYIIPKGV